MQHSSVAVETGGAGSDHSQQRKWWSQDQRSQHPGRSQGRSPDCRSQDHCLMTQAETNLKNWYKSMQIYKGIKGGKLKNHLGFSELIFQKFYIIHQRRHDSRRCYNTYMLGRVVLLYCMLCWLALAVQSVAFQMRPQQHW